METDKKNTQQELPEDMVIYAPIEYIISIEHVINNLETVSRDLLIVAEKMKPISD